MSFFDAISRGLGRGENFLFVFHIYWQADTKLKYCDLFKDASYFFHAKKRIFYKKVQILKEIQFMGETGCVCN